MPRPIARNTKSALSFLSIALISLLPLSCGLSPFTTAHYPDGYFKGMNIFFMPPRNTFNEADFSESLLRLKSIGINALFLIPYYFSNDEYADSIFPTSQTISDQDLSRAIELSQQAGFRPILKPHIDLRNGVPRNKIDPRNADRWFQSYADFICHYAIISKQYGLDQFVVGTELDKMADNSRFAVLCQELRAEYGQPLMYASSYDHCFSAKIWNAVDIIGVNAYFNLDNADQPSRSTITETWNYWLNLLSDCSAVYNKPLIITEIGYLSRAGSAQNPGDWSQNAQPDMAIQQQCYQALLSQAAAFENIKGIFWWQWELGKFGGPGNTDYTPRDKPAQEVIKEYWYNE